MSSGLLCSLLCAAGCESAAHVGEADAAGRGAAGTSRPLAGREASAVPPPTAAGQLTPATAMTGFVATEFGGYKLGPQLASDAALPGAGAYTGDASRCSVMTAVVRDFRGAAEVGGHPDFEIFDGKGPTKGLVQRTLDAQHKPAYASQCEQDFSKSNCPYGQMTTSAERFAQWYRNTPGVNLSYALQLAFEAHDDVYTFETKNFFPLDDAGFGNSGGKKKHNFSFTTELHGSFRYLGGESFTFTGDDDLWLFIAGQLALDLGGLHPPASARLDMDVMAAQLGLKLGEEYTFDLFHAERHSANSNFRVDTSLAFTACGKVEPELL